MKSIPKLVDELSHEVVLLYPKSFATAGLRGDLYGDPTISRVIAVPLPYHFQPNPNRVNKLKDVELVWHAGQYFIIAPAIRQAERLFWVLCEAYVALGFLPPALIADIRGEIQTEADLLVVAACKRSISLARDEYAENLKAFKQRFDV